MLIKSWTIHLVCLLLLNHYVINCAENNQQRYLGCVELGLDVQWLDDLELEELPEGQPVACQRLGGVANLTHQASDITMLLVWDTIVLNLKMIYCQKINDV